MATFKEFTEIDAWKLSRVYCKELYAHFSQTSWAKNAPLRNQLDRSSGSIMDNIAEGHDRGGNKEFKQFLSIAKGSCGESISQIYRAHDRHLLTKEEAEKLVQDAKIIKAKIGGLMTYLAKSERKGFKYD